MVTHFEIYMASKESKEDFPLTCFAVSVNTWGGLGYLDGSEEDDNFK